METICIQLDKPPKGMDHALRLEGRALAKNWDKLRVFAQELKARPLDDFFEKESSSAVWFAPSDALATLERLLRRIASDKRGMDNVRLLIRDLNSYENILSSAQARGSKFRFSTQPEEER
jgi:hypothetical protein